MNYLVTSILLAIVLTAYSEVRASTSTKALNEGQDRIDYLWLVRGIEDFKLSYNFKETLNQPLNEDAQNNWLSFDLKTKKPSQRNDAYFEGGARYYHGSNDFMFSVPEAYVARENSTNLFVAGRKILDWNKYERFWGFNSINAQRSYDLLDNKQEGLVGLFYEQSFLKNFKASAFLSYFYIPQMNPPIKIKDGKITSPADHVKYHSVFNFKDRERPIIYELNKPQIKDIIFQKSLGFNLTYGKRPFTLSSYALYKPENKLRINARSSLDRTAITDTAVVTAEPFVNYHGVYGSVIGFQHAKVQNYLGFEVIDANTELDNLFKTIDPLKVEPEQRPAKNDDFDIRPSYISQTYMYYSAIVPRDIYQLSFNYIRLLSRESIQKDSFFQEASRFINAVGLGGSLNITEQWVSALRWYYDLDRKDNIVKAEIGWSNKTFAAMVGVDVLKAPDQDSYWSNFRTNDSIYTKLSIGF